MRSAVRVLVLGVAALVLLSYLWVVAVLVPWWASLLVGALLGFYVSRRLRGPGRGLPRSERGSVSDA